jgi:hypothetical protein
MLSNRRTVVAVVAAAAASLMSGCGSASSPFEDLSNKEALIASAQRETPLPPGSHYDASRFQTQPGNQYAKGYFVAMAQDEAQCKWYMYWLRSDAAGDTAAMNRAGAFFTSMKSWALYTETDDGTRQFYDTITQAASLGDPTGLQSFVGLNCHGITP